MKKGSLKRKAFDDEELSNFDIIQNKLRRCQYQDEEIEKLREYMVDNTFTRTSPCMDDTVWERDIFDDFVRNEEGKPYKVQRVLISVCPCQLHVHMMEEKKEGGYPPARAREREKMACQDTC